jgi:hypothetical protein
LPVFLVFWCSGNVAVFGVDGKQRMEWKALHFSFVNDVDWAHADRCVSSSFWDETCKVWDPQTGRAPRCCEEVYQFLLLPS